MLGGTQLLLSVIQMPCFAKELIRVNVFVSQECFSLFSELLILSISRCFPLNRELHFLPINIF
jgi:hypothetical protein